MQSLSGRQQDLLLLDTRDTIAERVVEIVLSITVIGQMLYDNLQWSKAIQWLTGCSQQDKMLLNPNKKQNYFSPAVN